MKKLKLIGSAAALLGCTVMSSHADITLAYSNVGNAEISFNNGVFSFVPSTSATGTGYDFSITGSSSVGQDSIGDLGTISSSFSIGTVTTSGPGTEIASVTDVGTSVITIKDGTGTLTGNLTWDSISSVASGVFDLINVDASVNLQSLVYTGTGSDLTALAYSGVGMATMDFSFNSAHDLDSLVAAGTGNNPIITDSFAGQLSSVPEPTTVIAGALLLLPFGASTLRVIRRNRAA